jgi:hypothetical protein
VFRIDGPRFLFALLLDPESGTYGLMRNGAGADSAIDPPTRHCTLVLRTTPQLQACIAQIGEHETYIIWG